MIEWCKTKKLSVIFDDIPCVGIRYILPGLSNSDKKSIKKYPFICRKTINVTIIDYSKKKKYEFKIQRGYCFDGATIPKSFRRIIGSPTDNKFLIAALIHDVLCENHNYINNDRALSTDIFNALLAVSDVNPLSRFLMKNGVACFQTLFCRW